MSTLIFVLPLVAALVSIFLLWRRNREQPVAELAKQFRTKA